MDLFPRSFLPVTISRLKNARSGCTPLALLCLALFVAGNAFKLSAFNLLIVSSGVFPSFSAIVQGMPGKLVLVTALVIILTRLHWRFAIVLFYLIQTLYIAVNAMYYLAFLGYLHISQYFSLFSESWELVTHASLPWDASWLILLFDLPFLVGIVVLYKRLHATNRELLFKPVLYGAGVCWVIALSHWEPPIESPLKVMNNEYSSDAAVVSKFGILTFNCMDLFNYRSDRSLVHSISYGPEVSAAGNDTALANILIIQVESLDAKIINYRYNGRYVMPFMHALSGSSVFFPYCLSYHLAGSTSDCEFSTINSIEPFRNYPSMKIRNYEYPNSILKLFSANGYSVVAFHGNHGFYFNRNSSYKRMGFSKFYDQDEMRLPESGWGIPDSAVLNFVKSKLPSLREPFLCYIVTMSSHEPYTLVKDYWHNRQFDHVRDGIGRNYLNAISYVDASLRAFITSVRQSHPNTVILIYGDHTPNIPKTSSFKATRILKGNLFEFVPLFVITPDRKVYHERSIAASFLDVAPTILAASGCSGSIRSNGVDLLDMTAKKRDVPFCGAIYTRKYLYRLAEKGR